MSIQDGHLTIRNVDPEIFRRMRAEAVHREVRLGDLINQALGEWLELHERVTLPGPVRRKELSRIR